MPCHAMPVPCHAVPRSALPGRDARPARAAAADAAARHHRAPGGRQQERQRRGGQQQGRQRAACSGGGGWTAAGAPGAAGAAVPLHHHLHAPARGCGSRGGGAAQARLRMRRWGGRAACLPLTAAPAGGRYSELPVGQADRLPLPLSPLQPTMPACRTPRAAACCRTGRRGG